MVDGPTHGAPVFPVREDGPRSGLLYLRNKVEAYFVGNSVQATIPPVGLKYRWFTLNQALPGNGNRVLFIPGEFDGESSPKVRPYGTLSRANRNAGKVINPRELLTWERAFTLSIWAAPVPGLKDDEGASIDIVENLFEETVRAIQMAAQATIKWGDVSIVAPPVENAFGVELLVSAVQIGPLFDVVYDYVQPKAVIERAEET